MLVEQVPKQLAIEYIRKYHYSNILPRLTKYWLGFYENNDLIGVVTLGWGTQPLQTIKKIFNKNDYKTNDYLEIGKMCFKPSNNQDKSTGSKIIKELKTWIKNNTDVQFLYTLADGIMGKVGYVYQASSFYYIGSFKTSVYLDNNTKEKIHPRSAKKLCIENAQYKGVEKVSWLTDDFCKYKNIDKINGLMFRYILPLNKKADKTLKSYNMIKLYPKDKDLVFEKRISNGKFIKINKPNFNMEVSNYNYQKW
jgi:hypothetical protein